MTNKSFCKFYSLSKTDNIDAIKKGYWYSTPPKFFNDIADCNSELLDFNEVCNQYENSIKKTDFDIIEREKQNKIALNANNKLINNYIGITCFSSYENFNNHLMWAHYAENHKGICLEFRSISPSKKIEYFRFKENLPDMPYEIVQQFLTVKYKRKYKVQKETQKIFSIKKRCWKYEKESRLIQISPPLKPLDSEHRKIYYNKRNVSKIFIGKCFTKNENHQEVLKIIKEEYKQSTLFEMILQAENFELICRPVKIVFEDKMYKLKKE
jgi:hypothetical protein